MDKKLNVLAATGFVIMWSSGFIGARLGTDEAASMTVLMWRFITAAAILGIWWLWKRRTRLSPKSVMTQVLIGLLAQGGYLYCVFLSVEQGVSAGTSNLITTLQPIAAALLAGPFLKEVTSRKQWIGLFIGITGVLFVVYGDLGKTSGVPLWAYGLSFAAMIALVIATLFEKTIKHPLSLMDALPIQTAVTAVFFTAVGIASDKAAPPAAYDFWFAIGWVAGLSTIGGYGFYWLNLKIGSVTRVSSLLYLTPPVTMIWAYFMFGDTIGFLTISGMIICFLGVWVIQKAEAGPCETDPYKQIDGGGVRG
ncbi:DMT family transporter [Halobacillus litoralis]|uniref:DMT family transporter n=1 Tax=Halobacillus litoralis TaxID=45668 RepID=UPI001CD26D33|nr:DMT family transporter [Halobacillus litoralis]MCA1022927.1 DMT family transporter [Halobacillus litoralis]